MVQIVRMPMMGNTMEIGTLIEWVVEEGDPVEENDIVAVVESEKSSMDIVAEQDGRLSRIDVSEGAEVKPGTVLGVVLSDGESLEDVDVHETDELSTSDAGEDGAAEDGPEPAITATDETEDAGAGGAATDTGGDPDRPALADSSKGMAAGIGDANTHTRASPSTRRLARELSVNLRAVEGTGASGRVTTSDVRAKAGNMERSCGTADDGGDASAGIETGDVTVVERREFSGVRKTIATRMASSAREAPHVTLERTVSVERALAAAEEVSEVAEVDVGFNDLLVAASARALETHPSFNAWVDDGATALVAERNIAVAVDTDRGLLTPVIEAVSDRSLTDIAQRRTELVEGAFEGTLASTEMQNATFTISNLGMFEVDAFDPIINPPQVAILGVGRIRDGSDGPECTLCLSFDHRTVDGADAARFLNTLVEALARPTALALESGVACTIDGRGEDTTATYDAEEALERAIRDDIVERAREVASWHGWPLPTFDVEFTEEDAPKIRVQSEDGVSQATQRRLVHAACRESRYANRIVGLRDPDVRVAEGSREIGSETIA